MSFYSTIERLRATDLATRFAATTPDQVRRALATERLSEDDFLALLSPAADGFLEAMAQRARATTRRHFGNVVFVFTPMYISNVCVNQCQYCAFAARHNIRRLHLTLDQIEDEAERIAADGIRNLLILTGEARRKATPEYLRGAVRLLSGHFASVGIEVYPLTEAEYAATAEAGADMLTIYQEVYHEPTYAELHAGGPKADYRFRLDAPERAAHAGLRGVAVGALLGLYHPLEEAFITGLHANWLQSHFPGTEVSVSLPRIRPFEGEFDVPHDVNDRLFVRFLTALRCFLPTVGITVSTREGQAFRDAILPLGVTRMSAGVSTAVGGHGTDLPSTAQFEIADKRSVADLQRDLVARGYQPVMHDWNTRYLAAT